MTTASATLFFTTHKKWILLGIALIVLFVVGRWAYKKGYFRNIISSTPQEASGLTDAENAQARALAVTLHTDLKGISYSRNMTAWREFMGLRDAVARQVYNVFGELYFEDSKETLTDWVADEWAWADSMSIASHAQILARLANMGLTPTPASMYIPAKNISEGRMALQD